MTFFKIEVPVRVHCSCCNEVASTWAEVVEMRGILGEPVLPERWTEVNDSARCAACSYVSLTWYVSKTFPHGRLTSSVRLSNPKFSYGTSNSWSWWVAPDIGHELEASASLGGEVTKWIAGFTAKSMHGDSMNLEVSRANWFSKARFETQNEAKSACDVHCKELYLKDFLLLSGDE